MKVGDKVVCINDYPYECEYANNRISPIPIKGSIYTIKEIVLCPSGDFKILLNEILYRQERCHCGKTALGLHPNRYRLLYDGMLEDLLALEYKLPNIRMLSKPTKNIEWDK